MALPTSWQDLMSQWGNQTPQLTMSGENYIRPNMSIGGSNFTPTTWTGNLSDITNPGALTATGGGIAPGWQEYFGQGPNGSLQTQTVQQSGGFLGDPSNLAGLMALAITAGTASGAIPGLSEAATSNIAAALPSAVSSIPADISGAIGSTSLGSGLTAADIAGAGGGALGALGGASIPADIAGEFGSTSLGSGLGASDIASAGGAGGLGGLTGADQLANETSKLLGQNAGGTLAAGGTAIGNSNGGLSGALSGLSTGNSTLDGLLKQGATSLLGGAAAGQGGASTAGAPGTSILGSLGGNAGNLLNGLYDLYANRQAANQIGPALNSLNNMFGPNSPYAQQMEKQLDARDAAAGRRSQYGERAVELAGKLSQAQAQVLSSPGYLALNQAYAQNNLGGPAGFLSALQQGGNNSLLNQGLSGLASLFGGGGSSDVTTNPSSGFDSSFWNNYLSNPSNTSTGTNVSTMGINPSSLGQQTPQNTIPDQSTNNTTALPQARTVTRLGQQVPGASPSATLGQMSSPQMGTMPQLSRGLSQMYQGGNNPMTNTTNSTPNSGLPNVPTLADIGKYSGQYGGNAYTFIPGANDFGAKQDAVNQSYNIYQNSNNPALKQMTLGDIWQQNTGHSQDYWQAAQNSFNAGQHPTTQTQFPGIGG